MICCAGTLLVVLLLDFVARQRAADDARHRRHVATGSSADQAASADCAIGRKALRHAACSGCVIWNCQTRVQR